MNLNKVAKEITKKEGKKHPLSIGDVKEVMHILFTDYSLTQIIQMKLKYRKGGE
jgi:hypothetical protein